MRWLTIAALALGLLPAAAHEGPATGFATLEVVRNVLRYTVAVSQLPASDPAAPGAAGDAAEALLSAVATRLRIAADGTPCVTGPGRLIPGTGAALTITAQVDFVCRAAPGKLELRDDLYDVLGEDLHVLLRIERPDGDLERMMASEARVWSVALDAGSAAAPQAGVGRYFVHGVEHILIGYDHLLFLLALLLRARTPRSVLALVTAFTIAHSVTLALAALGYVELSPALVEAAIAASIVLVAVENLSPGESAARRRWQLAFLFGLVHGFGFSSVLGGIGLPPDLLVPALVSFNLGVEAGQLLAVALAWPPLVWLASRAWQPSAARFASCAIATIGLALLVTRIPALH